MLGKATKTKVNLVKRAIAQRIPAIKSILYLCDAVLVQRSNKARSIVSSALVKGRFKSTHVGQAVATTSKDAVGARFLENVAVKHHTERSTVRTDNNAQKIRGMTKISRPLKAYIDVPVAQAYA
jgi:restriction endonuclease Mrr